MSEIEWWRFPQSRYQTKLEMIRDRQEEYGTAPGNNCWCDMCGEEIATDMHEIVNRNLTVQNDEARELTFSKFLCSMLGKKCHEIAGTNESKLILIMFNIELYTYDDIFGAFSKLDKNITKFINFPEGK